MDLKDYRVKKQELDDTIAKHGKSALVKEFQAFFEKNPEIAALRWTQYTPHFNDGDPCEFSRHEFQVKLDFVGSLKEDSEYGQEEECGEDGDGFMYDYQIREKPKLLKAIQQLNRTFRDTDDVFQAAFGDGYRIVANRDGFEVEEYDHD